MSIFLINSYVYEVSDTPVERIANAQAMSFNGTDQYVAFDNLTLSNEYTISLWMYSDIGTNAGYFLTNGNTEASAVGFKIDNNGANIGRLEYWDGTNNTFGTIPSPASWNHVAFVANVSGSTITSYINGSVDTTVTGVTVQTMYNLIGAYTPTGGNKFLGKIDEVAIFNTALSATQIKDDIYNASLPLSSNKTADLENNPNLPTPVAWYRMGDN